MRFGHQHPFGVVRREVLQVGFSGFIGLGLSGLLAGRARADGAGSGPRTGGPKRARGVILVFQTGGPSHLETFDPKPEAPAEIRGAFGTIASSVPGIHFAEHLPLLAEQAEKLAVVRTMSHSHNNHLNATHWVLTGHEQPGAFFDKVASRTDYPCYASAMTYLRPREDGLPGGVMLPTYLMEGPLTWPGQHSGFLGPKYDPWQLTQDPNGKDFKVENLRLPEGFSVERLGDRRALAEALASNADSWHARAEAESFSQQRQQAYSMLASGQVGRAFDLAEEPDHLRDRYGRHMFGQSLLLARRLIEAGIPIVQVNLGRVQTWDSHADIFRRLREDLLPPTDRGVSALLDDLEARGLLDEVLVVLAGEFGRTPKLSLLPGQTIVGRDHWPQVFSAAFAGAGVRGGQVIGRSDKSGAYPATKAFSPADLAATVYRALGIDGEAEVIDLFNRPIRLVTGEPIEALYSGEAV
ncbi:DUF1501 domain-containing protein [Tautonia sociabilis]|uniref:DUF1501 domain-containing protein n=1 Tax=Tautonia sociabilis TaxID=2080755 RepID=A0A432MJ66_9BACT|nr:DUF1501 domain-containing protein [Tautonia sociabilis]RUL87412.1 DUF1501 domain-containing protein [Tautonia sociabilis]